MTVEPLRPAGQIVAYAQPIVGVVLFLITSNEARRVEKRSARRGLGPFCRMRRELNAIRGSLGYASLTQPTHLS